MDKTKIAIGLSVIALLMVIPLWLLPIPQQQGSPTPLVLGTPSARFGISWEDLRVAPNVRQAAGTGVPAFETWIGGALRCYSFTDEAVAGNQKEVFMFVQMPHSWRLGTAIHPHVHWIGDTTVTTSTVAWGIEYSWAEPYGTFTSTTTIITATAKEDGDINTTALKHYITELGIITPTAENDNVSTIMVARLYRNSAIATDTYTGKACMAFFDIHYLADSIGSISEYNK